MNAMMNVIMDGPIFTWLLKTRMTFYNDDALQLPWWFGACCWNFAIAGAFMLWIEPAWVQHPQKITILPSLLSFTVQFPYQTIAYLLIFVQAPLSFLADYVNMKRDSYWHIIDRLLAVPIMATEIIKVTCMALESIRHFQLLPNSKAMPIPLVVLYFMALIFAIYCFLQSNKAQANRDHQGFILWHNTWHLYPLVAVAIFVFDFYVCHGWQRCTRQYMYSIVIQKATKL
ncbi:expressed unknown protein [Seminavis robusta]|uniref:Uncharacterized protein n=1 Tax=Seminavis robusta TaxID=568900 RepID=A0A9N8E4J0_9STRA|nr:expressed unknown protein [Seminavis robusta]|eukprot:Sro542_g163310.1 n/a (229) ;mRNA; r:12009-12695